LNFGAIYLDFGAIYLNVGAKIRQQGLFEGYRRGWVGPPGPPEGFVIGVGKKSSAYPLMHFHFFASGATDSKRLMFRLRLRLSETLQPSTRCFEWYVVFPAVSVKLKRN